MRHVKVGDVVVLKSGGPKMVVSHCADLQDVSKIGCTYFSNGVCCRDLFYLATLLVLDNTKEERLFRESTLEVVSGGMVIADDLGIKV